MTDESKSEEAQAHRGNSTPEYPNVFLSFRAKWLSGLMAVGGEGGLPAWFNGSGIYAIPDGANGAILLARDGASQLVTIRDPETVLRGVPAGQMLCVWFEDGAEQYTTPPLPTYYAEDGEPYAGELPDFLTPARVTFIGVALGDPGWRQRYVVAAAGPPPGTDDLPCLRSGDAGGHLAPIYNPAEVVLAAARGGAPIEAIAIQAPFLARLREFGQWVDLRFTAIDGAVRATFRDAPEVEVLFAPLNWGNGVTLPSAAGDMEESS